MSTPDEIQQMLEDVEKQCHLLTDWECEFIDSISYQLGKGRGLSDKQDETLEKIWNRVTSS